MATTAKTTEAQKPTKVLKAPVKLADRIKNQINQAALRNKISVDELSDLQQHLNKVMGLLA